jgi:hypothetical protein
MAVFPARSRLGIDVTDPRYYTVADGDGQTTAAHEADVDVGPMRADSQRRPRHLLGLGIGAADLLDTERTEAARAVQRHRSDQQGALYNFLSTASHVSDPGCVTFAAHAWKTKLASRTDALQSGATHTRSAT